MYKGNIYTGYGVYKYSAEHGIRILKEESDMWNIKSDTFGWNLYREASNLNYHCHFCKENNKCAMSSLIHCDYRKDGKCTQCKGK